MKNRHVIREYALQAMYAFQLSHNTIEQVVSDPIIQQQDNVSADPFFHHLVESTARYQNDIDLLIEGTSANWHLERMSLIDRIILRMAIAEFLYFPDIPPKVSIDEAIELAKKYSTDESSRFINGILDKLLSELKQANKIIKTGRGTEDRQRKNQIGSGD